MSDNSIKERPVSKETINLNVVRPPMNIYDYVFSLEEQVRTLQKEKQAIFLKHNEMNTELKKLRQELKDLREPPYVVGVVQEVLEDSRIVVKNSNGIEFLLPVPDKFKEQIVVGCRVALGQKSLSIEEVLHERTDRRINAMEIIEKPKPTFKDIGGLENVIQELNETIILPITHPQKFKNLGIEPPKGVLLHGQPGTGKTLLAKAVANETNSTFISLTGSELVKKYIGEGATLVKDLFKMARKKKTCCCFH